LNKRTLAALVAPLVDLLLLPLVVPAGVILKATRRFGLQRLRACRAALLKIGLLPVRSHYYEPFIDPATLRFSLDRERPLPGIDWNLAGQLAGLESLVYAHELADLQAPRTGALQFRLNNGSFESGDAEFLYQLIRARRPARIVEIGSGNSTLIARRAILQNRNDAPDYRCEHICIEPFEAPWLEQTGVTTLRKRVEEVALDVFQALGENDLLFIDSSHVIRPQGDVLAEYLQILPSLRRGVIVHIHDIFSPRDYPKEWLDDGLWLWNEQYLVEAFLTQSSHWQVLAALNLLRHRHFDALRKVCPYLTADREPGSLYIQKIG
jgi:predicted O-methyltransferase YrrM